jgi:hypothetical protein
MLLYADNFESYVPGTAGWTALMAAEPWTDDDVPDLITLVEDGWHARRALHVPFTAQARYTFSSGNTLFSRVLMIQAGFKLGSLADTENFFGLQGIVTLFSNLDGSIRLERGGLPVATSGAGILKAGQWHYLEVKAAMTSSSRLQVRIDGALIFDLSAVNITVSTTWDFRFEGGSDGVTWSEVVVMDGLGASCNDLLGPATRIAMLPAAATMTISQFTGVGISPLPPTSRFHEYVDDALPGPNDGAATEISSIASLAVATFRFDPPQNARSFENVSLLVTPGLAPPYARVKLSMDLDPDGDKPWTYRALRAIEAGATTLITE